MDTIDRYLAEKSDDIELLRENFIESLDKFDAIKDKLIKKIDNLTELKEFYNKNCPLNKKNNRQVYYKFLMVYLNKIENFELNPDEKELIAGYTKYACYRAIDKQPSYEEIEYIRSVSGIDCQSFFDEFSHAIRKTFKKNPDYISIGFDFDSINYFTFIDGRIHKQFNEMYEKKLKTDKVEDFLDKDHDPDGNLKVQYEYYSKVISKILITIVDYKYKSSKVTRLFYKNFVKDTNKKLKKLDLTSIINLLINEISEDKSLINRLDSELIEMLTEMIKEETNKFLNDYKYIQYDFQYNDIKHLIAPSRIDTKKNIMRQSIAYANSSILILTTMIDLEKVGTKDEIFSILKNFYSKPEDISYIDETINFIPKPGLSEAEYEEN